MKLVINYDLISKIRDVNDPFTPLKELRNHKLYYGSLGPLYVLINLPYVNLFEALCISSCDLAFINIIRFGIEKIDGRDKYKDMAEQKLRRLVPLLNSCYVDTNYDLLLHSQAYKTEYKVHLNMKKIPEVLQKKYIIVPTYNYNNDIKETSILQEHIVGGNDWVLSLGTPKKKTRLAYNGA